MARKYHQGKFFPKHPEKYVGDINNIIFRSSWEHKLLKELDENPNVEKYGSEEFSIHYHDPVTDKTRRYFPDVFALVKRKDGKKEKLILEVKPFAETIEPLKMTTATGKLSNRYLTEAATYATNCAKWEAARKFCAANGIKFVLFTEYELGIKRRPK